jgi:tetratricopeptide (TPR) repeat protein
VYRAQFISTAIALWFATTGNAQRQAPQSSGPTFQAARGLYNSSCFDREGQGFDTLRCRQAAAAFGALVAANSSDADTQYYYGSANYHLLQPDDPKYGERRTAAITALREAIRLSPRMIRAYYDLASVLADADKPDEPIALLHQVLAIDPRQSRAYVTLITILQNVNRIDEMLAVYRQYRAVIPIKPNEIPVDDVDVALTLERAGRMADSASVLGIVLRSDAVTKGDARSLCGAFLDIQPEKYQSYPRLTEALARLRKVGECH